MVSFNDLDLIYLIDLHRLIRRHFKAAYSTKYVRFVIIDTTVPLPKVVPDKPHIGLYQ